MSGERQKSRLSISQISRYGMGSLAVCVVCLVPFYANGQKAPAPSNPLAPSASTPSAVNKNCEGSLPSQASARQDQTATEGGTDRLKLSTKAGETPSEPQGQFCRRERTDQNLRPSVSPDQPDTAPASSQPATDPPIAQVTDGKLTIRANGQNFASVLESVRAATGLTVEMPPSANSDPVFLNFGPAKVSDALVALLDGTNYNYMILGSDQDPRVVKRLILTAKAGAGTETLVASTQAAPVVAQGSLYGGLRPDTGAEASEPPPPPPVPIQPSAISSSIPVGTNIQKLAAESGKTTGQILDELQKQQEQMLDEQAASQSQSAPQQ